MKDRTSLTVFGAGQSNIPLSLAGSVMIFPFGSPLPYLFIFDYLISLNPGHESSYL
jgi:hypothetical protein